MSVRGRSGHRMKVNTIQIQKSRERNRKFPPEDELGEDSLFRWSKGQDKRKQVQDSSQQESQPEYSTSCQEVLTLRTEVVRSTQEQERVNCSWMELWTNLRDVRTTQEQGRGSEGNCVSV